MQHYSFFSIFQCFSYDKQCDIMALVPSAVIVKLRNCYFYPIIWGGKL